MDSFGFIHEKLDIKILILYVLRRLPGSVEPNTLLELCLFDGALLLFNGVAELVAVKRGEYLSTAHMLAIPDEHPLNGQGRLKRQVGEAGGHHLAHGPYNFG